MPKRVRERITNSELAVRQDRLEVEVKEIKAQVAPLHATMLEIRGAMRVGGLLLGAVSFIGTCVGIWVALRGH